MTTGTIMTLSRMTLLKMTIFKCLYILTPLLTTSLSLFRNIALASHGIDYCKEMLKHKTTQILIKDIIMINDHA